MTKEDQTPPVSPSHPLHILVVEDNPDTAQSLCELLTLFEFDVEAALDGLEGLKRFEQAPPEVVLCDIGLPGMDGYEVARQIRQRERQKTLLIAITGYGEGEVRERAREAGFDALLTKPAPLDQLLELIEHRRSPAAA